MFCLLAPQPQKYAIGYKNITANDNFFTGHFPERKIMPGASRNLTSHSAQSLDLLHINSAYVLIDQKHAILPLQLPSYHQLRAKVLAGIEVPRCVSLSELRLLRVQGCCRWKPWRSWGALL